MRKAIWIIVITLLALPALAQTTKPAAGVGSADDVLKDLLKPTRSTAQPLMPEPSGPKTNAATVRTVSPGGEALNLIREGTYLHDRVGRLTRTTDSQNELTLESDGKSLKDPPMLILPNLKLQEMEKYIQNTSKDLRFRVTGQITEYNGRNYILLDKVVVVPDQLPPASGGGGKKDSSPK